MSIDTPHRRTLKRIEHLGHARALNFCCFHNQPLLASSRAVEWTIDAIRRARERHPIHLWAWVIMPTHVHLLLCPTDHSITIGPVLSTIKQSVAKRARSHLTRTGTPFPKAMLDVFPQGDRVLRFWQRGGGYDRNITNPDSCLSEIRYIHANPVEAGLCARADDWPHSSIHAHLDADAGPIPLDLHSLPRGRPRAC